MLCCCCAGCWAAPRHSWCWCSNRTAGQPAHQQQAQLVCISCLPSQGGWPHRGCNLLHPPLLVCHGCLCVQGMAALQPYREQPEGAQKLSSLHMHRCVACRLVTAAAHSQHTLARCCPFKISKTACKICKVISGSHHLHYVDHAQAPIARLCHRHARLSLTVVVSVFCVCRPDPSCPRPIPSCHSLRLQSCCAHRWRRPTGCLEGQPGSHQVSTVAAAQAPFSCQQACSCWRVCAVCYAAFAVLPKSF